MLQLSQGTVCTGYQTIKTNAFVVLSHYLGFSPTHGYGVEEETASVDRGPSTGAANGALHHMTLN